MRIATTVCAATLWLGMVPLNAQAQTCEISVPATIVDATTGNFLSSIQPAMLHARIKKSYFPVNSLERIRSFRVLLLVDASGSMSSIDVGSVSNQRDTVQKIKEMLDEDLNSFPAGVQMSLGAFNKEIAFANEFTSDPDRLHHLIPRELSQKGVRLFVHLITDPTAPSTPQAAYAPGLMSDFANRAGGAVRIYDVNSLRWGDKRRLQSAKEELKRFWLQEVLSAYLVRFSIPAELHKEQKWLLAINPAANGKRKIAAGYPSRLEPCLATTAR
ncbi:MAG: hypothetical protein ACM3SW_09000 [Actinomycetota bacterium]